LKEKNEEKKRDVEKIRISRSESNLGAMLLALYANEKPAPHSLHTIYAI
jgi:hypothetical protein